MYDFFSALATPEPGAWTERPANIIMTGILGSRAYGLDTPTSDYDRRGVFLAPSIDFFGLDAPPPETADNPYADEVLWELAHFARLALKCNPSVLELLWLQTYELLTPIGEELIELRWAFVSADRVQAACLGAARSMLRDAQKKNERSAKCAQHLMRLLVTGLHFWQTGVLRPRLEDPDAVKAFGAEVAQGRDPAPLLDDYEQRFADRPTVLPPAPNRDRVNSWLTSVRCRHLIGG